jgi:hypothetical protein
MDWTVDEVLEEYGMALKMGLGMSRELESQGQGQNSATISYRELICRQCYKYDCREHGTNHPSPTSTLPQPVSDLLPGSVCTIKAAQQRSLDALSARSMQVQKSSKSLGKPPKKNQTNAGENLGEKLIFRCPHSWACGEAAVERSADSQRLHALTPHPLVLTS